MKELRRCYIEGQEYALFHEWTYSYGRVESPRVFGIVELHTGECQLVPISRIRFVDNVFRDFKKEE